MYDSFSGVEISCRVSRVTSHTSSSSHLCKMNEDLPQKLVRLQNQKAELAARLTRLEEMRTIELGNGCVALRKLLDVCEDDNRWISKVSHARGI